MKSLETKKNPSRGRNKKKNVTRMWHNHTVSSAHHNFVGRLLPILLTGKCFRKSTASPTGNVNRQSCQRNAIPSTSLLVLESGACQTKSGCNLGTGSLICNALAVFSILPHMEAAPNLMWPELDGRCLPSHTDSSWPLMDVLLWLRMNEGHTPVFSYFKEPLFTQKN